MATCLSLHQRGPDIKSHCGITLNQFVCTNLVSKFFPLSVFLHVNDSHTLQTIPICHIFPEADQDCQQQQHMKVYIRSWTETLLQAVPCVCVCVCCTKAYTWGADEDHSERFWLVTVSRCRGRVAVGRRPSAPGLLHPREGTLVQVGTKSNIIAYLSCLSKQKARLPPTSPYRFSRDWWLHGLRTINRGWGLWFVISS